MGRSRGGLTTRIDALVDALGLPILLKLTEGQAHDGRSAGDMLATLQDGCVLLADRAYDSDALRDALYHVALSATHASRPASPPGHHSLMVSLVAGWGGGAGGAWVRISEPWY
jgi:transposase